jgi:hypothetical protein
MKMGTRFRPTWRSGLDLLTVARNGLEDQNPVRPAAGCRRSPVLLTVARNGLEICRPVSRVSGHGGLRAIRRLVRGTRERIA